MLLAPAVAWIFVFTVVPVVILIVISFWTSTAHSIKPEWTVNNYRTIFSNYVYVETFLRTLRIAAVTTLLTLLAAYPIAPLLSRIQGRHKSVVLLLVFLPFWTWQHQTPRNHYSASFDAWVEAWSRVKSA